MKWIWNYGITRNLMGGFILFMIPVISFSAILNNHSIRTAQSEIVDSYVNSVRLLDRQMDDRLKALVNLIDSLTADTDVIYLNYNDLDEKSTVLAYASLFEKMMLFANTSLLNSKIDIYFQNKNRTISSRGGISEINDRDRTNVTCRRILPTGGG